MGCGDPHSYDLSERNKLLTGTLDDFRLPDIFRLLAATQRSGTLVLERSGGHGAVEWAEGLVVAASSSFVPDSLFERLAGSEVIGREQLRSAADEAARSGSSLEEVLAARGLLSLEQRRALRKLHTQDAAADLLGWEAGEFRWETQPFEPDLTGAHWDAGALLAAAGEAAPSSSHAQPEADVPQAPLTPASVPQAPAPAPTPAPQPVPPAPAVPSTPPARTAPSAQPPSARPPSPRPPAPASRRQPVPGPGNHAPAPPRHGDVFTIYLVGTYNRWRSPLVEGFLRRTTSHLPVRVRSVGTRNVGIQPPHRSAVEAAADFGVDITEHLTTPLSSLDLSEADLVVGFERHHVAAAVVDADAPRSNSFTLLELLELLDKAQLPETSDPLQRARWLVSRSDGERSHELTSELSVELDDPSSASATERREAAEQLRAMAHRLVARLFGPGRPPGERVGSATRNSAP